MATKAQIQANIDSLIDDGGLSTAEELRDALKNGPNSLLESLYPEVIQDSHLTSNLFVKDPSLPSDTEYYLNITKQGRVVVVNGQIIIPTVSSGIGMDLAKLAIPGEYRIKENLNGRRLAAAYIRDGFTPAPSTPTVLFREVSGELRFSIEFPVSGNSFFFQLTYITED